MRKAWGLSHERAAELAEEESSRRSGGAAGSLTFLPYLAGERTPNWPWAKGCVLGLDPATLASPEAAAGALYLAALEGATFSLLAGLRAVTAAAPADSMPPPRSVILVGGGARSDLWTRVVADSFGLPVSRPREPEAAALGAALQAAAVAEGARVREYVAATAPEVERRAAAAAAAAASSSSSSSSSPSSSSSAVTEPDPTKREGYDEAFARHQALGEALFGEEGGVAKKMFLG